MDCVPLSNANILLVISSTINDLGLSTLQKK
jgi:hypothetical protein